MRWIIAGTHTLDSVICVSTYHLVRYLSENPEEAENQILYLPAPVSPLHYLLKTSDARFQERKPLTGNRPVQWGDKVWQHVPRTLVPVLQKSPFNTPWALRHSLDLTIPSLPGTINSAGFLRPDILMVTNLQYACLDQIVRPRCLIYRCVDDIRGFASAPSSLAQAETELLKRCDICLATSVSLAEKLIQRGGRNVHIIRHGVDLSAFANLESLPEPVDLAPIPHPRIVYVGTLSSWFHTDYLKAAADRLPSYHFVLIGPRETPSIAIPEKANIHALGPRPPREIPAYLAHCDAAMIPFKISPLVESVLPLKLYEYLAAGLPVVASRWKELELTEAPIDLAKTEEQFIQAIQSAPGKPGREKRLAFARQNTWQHQFDRMMTLIKETNCSGDRQCQNIP